jgi:hypothetical protein
MKTLVIHPQDPTTDFLKPIYQALPDTTVVKGGVFKDEIIDLIMQHDRVIMLGHGTPSGLLAVGRFPGDPPPWNIIDHSMVPYLRQTENIFIWCHANKFVERHNLRGLYSGMFISEVGEAEYCEVEATQNQVDISNYLFSYLLGSQLLIDPDLRGVYQNVGSQYSILAESNKVVEYNSERWFMNG